MNNKTVKAIVNGIGLIPLLWISILYLFTVLCWWKLGHFPIPSINDPKYIGFSLLYYLAVMGMILVIPVMVVWVLLLPISIKQNLLTKRNVFVMIIGSAVALLQLFADPFQLIYWLLD